MKSKKTQFVPKLFTIVPLKMDYTIPKLYIPKIKVNGKKVTTLKKRWCVYFYFRNPITKKYDSRSKFKFFLGINRYKTISGRKLFGNALIGSLTEMLKEGYDPYNNTIPIKQKLTFDTEKRSVKDAIDKAITDKKLTWATSTSEGIIFRVTKFLDFAEKHDFINDPASELKRVHVIEFLNTIKKKETATSVNNYRGAISSVFSQMVQNNDLEYNFVKDVRKEKATPIKNHPFTNQQIAEIKEYLQIKDPYLLQFIRVLAYSFLRNREVIRLRVQDVDLKNNIISIKTKTKALDRVYITKQLKTIFEEMDLQNYNSSDYIFTPENKPSNWIAPEKSKTDHFSFRFKKVKQEFNFGVEYGIYSFRHSFAINIFNNFLKQGLPEAEAMVKMLPITRHDSIEGLRNYLRDKQKMLPKDFTDNITIDF